LQVAVQIHIDGVGITGGSSIASISAETEIVTVGYSATPTAGTRSVTLKATTLTATAALATLRALLVLVF